ncbi:hypothetical protein CkaCkLH20_10975 [Colletotrichum karsti]|uniref:Major facilitator superfamily (MFS) profile domain-containing protein n=1 Tax=Colletotrichum karsti TaxID=1095194 RepID=A0A9P6HW45_9PEZI|nr:uncharacterized protein CkaCkLH20_10975 [Colletotrichum karsti]KAF9871564.1 hypothetical protein CkaCkLH20_10975 [Colletotrichum karsti]
MSSSEHGLSKVEAAPKAASPIPPETVVPTDNGINKSDEVDDKEPVGALQQILSQRQLIIMFTLIWIFQFAMAFSSGIFGVLTPYVTSSFQKHALTATTSVVASIASGIVKLPYARLLDLWGRPHCMSAMVALATAGAVMMAACRNVETYCAAQVLYNVGYYGV